MGRGRGGTKQRYSKKRIVGVIDRHMAKGYVMKGVHVYVGCVQGSVARTSSENTSCTLSSYLGI